MARWIVVRALLWLPPLPLLYVALHMRNPYLIALRAFEAPLLLAASGLGLALVAACRHGRRIGRGEAGLLAVLLLAVALAAAWNEALFRRQRAGVLAADAATRSLGRHFVVGYTRFAEVATLAERGLIGGIYLSRSNVHGRTLAGVRAEVDALQDLRRRAGLPPLIVAADQEGGSVAHMTPPLAAMPPLAALVAQGSAAGLDARVAAYGAAQGRDLAALGVTLNLGPVADLRPAGRGPAFDTHTLIRRRAIAADPALVARVVAGYGRALLAQGVRPTLKHFPGLGGVTTDTHHFPARLDTPVAKLAAADWRPFRAAAQGGAAIMLAHVVLPEIDPALPASLSPAVAQGLLRGAWGYQGLLITDDLNMGAVYRRGIGNAAAAALAAGVDLVLVSYDPDQFYRAMHGAAAALRGGRLNAARLDASRRRIAAATGAGLLLPFQGGGRDGVGRCASNQRITPSRSATSDRSVPEGPRESGGQHRGHNHGRAGR